MKKIITMMVAAAMACGVNAQRVVGLVVKDGGSVIQTVNDFAAFNPAKDGSKPGHIEMILYPGQQRSNLTIEPVYGENCVLSSSSNPLPTDFTNLSSVFTVEDATSGKKSDYEVVMRNIKPAALPLKINFNSNTLTDSWTEDTEGWAAACIKEASNNVVFDGPYARSFVMAFTDSPKVLTFKAFVEKTMGPKGKLTLETSNGNGTWKTIHTYIEELPIGKEAIADFSVNLDSDVRYIRFVSNRDKANIVINNFFVTKAEGGSSIDALQAADVAAAYVNGALAVRNAEKVASVEVFDLAGQRIMSASAMNVIPFVGANGVYAVRMILTDGQVVVNKIIVE